MHLYISVSEKKAEEIGVWGTVWKRVGWSIVVGNEQLQGTRQKMMKLKSKERSGSKWAACYEKRMEVFHPIY
jgi:hypothetical protein